MTAVKEIAVRSAILGEIRHELNERRPADGYRPYDSKLVSDDLRDAFEIVAKGKPNDAVIDINEVVDAYATKLKASIDAVNVKGPQTLSSAEAKAIEQPNLRERTIALRTELSRGDKPLTDKELLRRAARFVTDHSAPIGQSGNALSVLFPAFDTGNGANWDQKQPGIDARLMTDPRAAQALLTICKGDASPEELRRIGTFDPARERLIVVADSDDETSYYLAAINKKTGQARGFDSRHSEPNFGLPENKAEFEAIFGKGSAKVVKDGDFESAFYETLRATFDKGLSLPIAKLDPPELDQPRLTEAAAEALQKYFKNLGALPAGDFSPDDKKTLQAIKRAVKAGDPITVGDAYGDKALFMPRRFNGKPTPDYAVGWAMSALFQAVPELARFYNVASTVQPPQP